MAVRCRFRAGIRSTLATACLGRAGGVRLSWSYLWRQVVLVVAWRVGDAPVHRLAGSARTGAGVVGRWIVRGGVAGSILVDDQTPNPCEEALTVLGAVDGHSTDLGNQTGQGRVG